MLYLPFTLAHIFLILCFWSSPSDLQHSQTVLILLIASTMQMQTYKQQIKATKNSRARALKQRAKRELAATIERTQETPIMELSLKRND